MKNRIKNALILLLFSIFLTIPIVCLVPIPIVCLFVLIALWDCGYKITVGIILFIYMIIIYVILYNESDKFKRGFSHVTRNGII